MYFPSIRDKWITIVIWGISLLGVILPLINQQYTATIIMMILGATLLWFWFRTGYKIEGDTIRIYYGPIRQTIRIPDIKFIIISRMPINSPALSFKRIQISCGKYEVVAISPQRRDEFISMLLDIRPETPVDERLLPEKHR
jgi:hypothetical protein